MVLGPAAFDCNVLSLDEAGFAQSLGERAIAHQLGEVWRWREDSKDADDRQWLLLRSDNARQRYRAAKQGDEAPTVHSILLRPPTARKPSTTRHGRGLTGAAIEDTVSISGRVCGNGGFRRTPAVLGHELANGGNRA